MDVTIYMPLLDEGTDAWRLVRAARQADGRYHILDEPDETETWPVEAGGIVECEWKVFSGGESGWAVTTAPPRAITPSNLHR